MNSGDVLDEFVDSDGLSHSAWKQALGEGYILGQECRDCGHRTAAPKAACARCGELNLETVELPTEGEVFAETTLAVTPEQFNEGLQAGIVDLGSAHLMAQFEGEVEIGDEVALVGTVEEGEEPGPLFE